MPLVWVADLAAGTPGGAGSEGSRQRRGSASTGENAGGRIKAARRCLYLRRNCPLNARLRFRSILIYPQYKHAVYARFRGAFRDNAENRPGKRGHTLRGDGYSAQVGGAREAGGSQVLQAAGVSPEGAASHGWSWRHSTEPEAEKSPGRLRAYRGGCSFGVFRRVNEYQERHEQDIKQHQAPSTSSRSISSRSQSSGAWGWRVTTPPRAMRSISRVSRV